jgi:hypothetical protein
MPRVFVAYSSDRPKESSRRMRFPLCVCALLMFICVLRFLIINNLTDFHKTWCECYAIIPDRYVILSYFMYAVVKWYKFTLEQSTKAQRESRGVALLFL